MTRTEQEDAAGRLGLPLGLVQDVGGPHAVSHDTHGIFVRPPRERETVAEQARGGQRDLVSLTVWFWGVATAVLGVQVGPIRRCAVPLRSNCGQERPIRRASRLCIRPDDARFANCQGDNPFTPSPPMID